MHKVAVLAFEGCKAGTVAGLLDALSVVSQIGRAISGRDDQGVHARVLSERGTPVSFAQGFSRETAPFSTLRPDEVLIVPGFVTDLQQIETLLPSHRKSVALIKRYVSQGGRLVAAHCTGVFLLAEAGLLDRRKAAVSWWAQPLFEQRYPHVELAREALMAFDGRVLCSAGPFSHSALATKVIEHLCGQRVAAMFASYATIDQGPQTQTPFAIPGLLKNFSPLPFRIERVVRSRLPEAVHVGEVARALAMSVRTLQRQLAQQGAPTAKEVIDRTRVAVARSLLQSGNAPLEEVMTAVGYTDASAFRRTFARHAGQPPSWYRKRNRALSGR